MLIGHEFLGVEIFHDDFLGVSGGFVFHLQFDLPLHHVLLGVPHWQLIRLFVPELFSEKPFGSPGVPRGLFLIEFFLLLLEQSFQVLRIGEEDVGVFHLHQRDLVLHLELRLHQIGKPGRIVAEVADHLLS